MNDIKAPTMGWSAAWRIARRDLNARFKGLRLLLVCIFLGTAALAAIGTLTAAIERELAGRGQELLGGDLEVEVWQRDLTADEKAALEEYGTISGGTRLQAMATTGDAAAPVELKAVDARWPLYGTLALKDGREVGAPTGQQAWLAQGAIDRLDIGVGDRFRIGTEELVVGGVIGLGILRQKEFNDLVSPVAGGQMQRSGTDLVDGIDIRPGRQ